MKKEYGVQPLDEVLETHSFSNDDLVKASDEQLTHKQVQKARKGKPVTENIKGKVVRALNTLISPNVYTVKDLFLY